MKATVITTGPGVIIATATASRNCRSLNQACVCTSSPYRKGTIARPLPKTNAPAFANTQKMFVSDGLSDVASAGVARTAAAGRPDGDGEARRMLDAVSVAVITPARTKSQAISRSVHAVVTAM